MAYFCLLAYFGLMANLGLLSYLVNWYILIYWSFSFFCQGSPNVPQKDRSPCVSQKVETILCVNLRLKFCASVWGWRLCDETVFQTPDRDKEEVDFLLETLETCNVKVILVIVQCNTPSPISTSPILGVATGGGGEESKFRKKKWGQRGGVRPEFISKNRPTGYNGFGLKGQQAV